MFAFQSINIFMVFAFFFNLLTSQHLSTVVSEEPLQQEEGTDGATANENNDVSGTEGQAQGLQDTRTIDYQTFFFMP